MHIIEVSGLSYEYGEKRALDDVGFSIRKGSVTALVGPNGAGKTTLLRCLTGLDRPLSGEIVMDGVSVIDDPRHAHRTCGYLSDFFGLYDALTVRQCLTYMAWCQKIPPADVAARVEKTARLAGLDQQMDLETGTLSRGNRQKAGIALALIHDPKIVILDEPASGMDPDARLRLSRLMISLREAGKTVIVSSHILNELEDYCTDMLVIRDGRIVSHVALKEYQRAKTHARVHLRLAAGADRAAALHVIGVAAEDDGETIAFDYDADAKAQADLLKKLVEAGVAVAGFSAQERKLQDAYMDVAGEKA